MSPFIYFDNYVHDDIVKGIRLTIVQMNSIAGNLEHNFNTIERFVEDNLDSDLICFPEMCLSGYSSEGPDRFAIHPDDQYVSKVHQLAERHDISIIFGYIEKDCDVLHLRQEIADGDGSKFYRKSHLGLKEAELFEPGNELPVFHTNGVSVGLQLCTESHIPDISSTYRSKGAEIILMPFANGISSERRKSVWHSYMPARACDNGLYVAGCSAIGDNGQGARFGGGLIAIDPKGMVIDEYYGDDERSITIDIGGKLPRDGPETMMNISYYDRRRPELYK